MPEGNEPTVSSYEEAINALSSLITKRSRADKSNAGDRFDLMFDYLKMLDLEEPISKLKVIHVAGTKGKNLFYVIVASVLGSSHLLTSLTCEKDSDWMVWKFVKKTFWLISGGVGID